jgi:kynurenine formamidase
MTERPAHWGFWGPLDERGSLNLIDAQAVMRAVASVRSGSVLTLGLPLKSGVGPVAPGRPPLQHFMRRDGGDYAAGLPERGFAFADDSIVLATHGTTHIDGLAHVWVDHQMWNGHSADAVSSRGAARCGIEKAGPIVTRAIFLDLSTPAGPCLDDFHVISAAELEVALAAVNVPPLAGDALLVRTGWLSRWRAGNADVSRCAGLGAGTAEWISQHGFAVVGCDNVMVEVSPSAEGQSAAPLHIELIRNRGVHLMELMDLDELAVTGRSSFMLVVSPLRLVGGTGSPVSPVAVL